ncbi:unnamed protein product [Ceutorhynchus assimilis]|uniref:Uncharacterized protein n=1 Tax=Ceutorhynchus assimilis TaxID=467358 RepID=A0A9N9QMC2_9CUCU|nr:unnamed protein product [Ceutorhynchus assimilis]
MTTMKVLSLWTQIVCVTALVAYDCQNPLTNITVISLRGIKPCPDPETGYHTEESYVQIIERKRFEFAQVRSCLVEVVRLISSCGMFSHQSNVEGGLLTYVHELSRDECVLVHAYGQFKGFEGHIIGRLVPNSRVSTSLVLAGKLDDHGKCAGAVYHEDGKSWENVVVQADIKVTSQDYYTKVSLETNEIHLRNGVGCPYIEGNCQDSVNGVSSWEINRLKDCYQYNIVYEGDATKVREKDTNKQALSFIVVEAHENIFAVQLVQKEKLCGEEVWQSEHPRLIVLIKQVATQVTVFSQLTKSSDADLITYVNTKFLYVEQSCKRGINSMFAQTVYRRCLLYRKILENRLILMALSPNAVAPLVKNTSGYVAKVAGKVVYLIKCVEITVELRRESHCYEELPVTAYNKSYFMTPITRILQQHGEQTECNALIPSLYNLDNQWVRFDPSPSTGIIPRELEVDAEENYPFMSIKDLGAGGIYTDSEIRRAQNEMIFGLGRNVLNNIIIRKMAGQTVQSQGFSSLNLFDKELENLANSTIQKLYGYFTIIGEWTSGFIGAISIGCVFEQPQPSTSKSELPVPPPPHVKPLPVKSPATKKYKFKETEETSNLSNSELQRLVLFEQLELIRIQKEREKLLLEKIQNEKGNNVEESNNLLYRNL